MILNWQEDEEYKNIIADLLKEESVQKLRCYAHHHYSNRLEHSLHVSYQSYRIAKRFHLDYTAVARAGLLHDLFYYDWRVTKFKEGSHAYVHPHVALNNARKITSINKKEADIIVKHMFGATIAPPIYLESWIVSLVDDYMAVDEYMIPQSYFIYAKIIFQLRKQHIFA